MVQKSGLEMYAIPDEEMVAHIRACLLDHGIDSPLVKIRFIDKETHETLLDIVDDRLETKDPNVILLGTEMLVCDIVEAMAGEKEFLGVLFAVPYGKDEMYFPLVTYPRDGISDLHYAQVIAMLVDGIREKLKKSTTPLGGRWCLLLAIPRVKMDEILGHS